MAVVISYTTERLTSLANVKLHLLIEFCLVILTVILALQVFLFTALKLTEGLVVFVAIDCLLGLVDCIYEAADLFGFSSANVVFVFISNNITTLMFLILSINAYSITFLSRELRMETIAPCRRKQCSTTFTTTIVMSKN
ncbi:hypothetical protein Y032_0033g2635 [Ancylostoma ceylanicum]|uniref:Uncharacterized protein n=1 Tax=Ancylostoma ceylanicum TaxID=53326 RepID=A0A016UPJ5_9BILA|nr:hypothetical protein Y032_0033g2635 [Ancylostoma ceylanicum]